MRCDGEGSAGQRPITMIWLLTTRISELMEGNARFSSARAACASAWVLKFPTRVYQLGALEYE